MTIELLIAGFIAVISTLTMLILLVLYTLEKSEVKRSKEYAQKWKRHYLRVELQHLQTEKSPQTAATE